MNKIKQAFKSRTIRKAVIVNGAAIVLAIAAEFELMALAALVNGILDVYLRSVTTEPLSAK